MSSLCWVLLSVINVHFRCQLIMILMNEESYLHICITYKLSAIEIVYGKFKINLT
jgi:hypothetical protein